MKNTGKALLRKCGLGCFLVLGIIIFLSGHAVAIPMLGVAPSSGGVYFGEYEDYLAYFVGDDGFLAGQGGFSMVSSGGDLTVWYGSDSGSPPADYNIFLLTTADMDFTYNGLPSTTYDGKKKVAAYFAPNTSTAGIQYYGVDLGNYEDLTGNWTLAPSDSPFNDGTNMEFYFYSGELIYNEGDFVLGTDWMFAVADLDGNGNPVNHRYRFSPKTTSTSHTPEPATMLLLGSGLIGLAAFGRRKFMKG